MIELPETPESRQDALLALKLKIEQQALAINEELLLEICDGQLRIPFELEWELGARVMKNSTPVYDLELEYLVDTIRHSKLDMRYFDFVDEEIEVPPGIKVVRYFVDDIPICVYETYNVRRDSIDVKARVVAVADGRRKK